MEVLEFLQNKVRGNLYELCVYLASKIVEITLNIPFETAKIKVIEPGRFLSDSELNDIRGGRAITNLSAFSCSPFEMCSSTMVFTTCTDNFNVACAMHGLTCGNPSVASYMSCSGKMEKQTCEGYFFIRPSMR